MVRDDPELLVDSGEVPKPNGVVGGLIPGRKIVSLLDKKKLAKCSKKKKYYDHLEFFFVENSNYIELID